MLRARIFGQVPRPPDFPDSERARRRRCLRWPRAGRRRTQIHQQLRYTALPQESRSLRALARQEDKLRKTRHAILAEGYLDVIACHRAGVTGALASLGTSLAEEQAKLLKHWFEAVTILYDGDTAGLKAADRAADILAAEGLIVDIATLPAGDDPDTVRQRDGSAGVERAAVTTRSPLDFRFDNLEHRLKTTDPAFWVEPFSNSLLLHRPNLSSCGRSNDWLPPIPNFATW